MGYLSRAKGAQVDFRSGNEVMKWIDLERGYYGGYSWNSNGTWTRRRVLLGGLAGERWRGDVVVMVRCMNEVIRVLVV
jgi:hypothetical protein